MHKGTIHPYFYNFIINYTYKDGTTIILERIAYNFHITEFFLKVPLWTEEGENDPFKSTGAARIKGFPVQLKCLIDT